MNLYKKKVKAFFIISVVILSIYIYNKYPTLIYIEVIGDFASIFTSIILEAMPFIHNRIPHICYNSNMYIRKDYCEDNT